MNVIILFVNLIKNLLSWFIRKPFHQKWLEALLKPVKTLNDQFVVFAAEQLDEVTRSSQVIILENILNNFYGLQQGDIYITHEAESIPSTFIFTEPEDQKEVYIYTEGEDVNTYIYSESEFLSDFDFTVNVPDSLSYNKAQLRALVMRYKIAGPRFNIVEYTP